MEKRVNCMMTVAVLNLGDFLKKVMILKVVVVLVVIVAVLADASLSKAPKAAYMDNSMPPGYCRQPGQAL